MPADLGEWASFRTDVECALGRRLPVVTDDGVPSMSRARAIFEALWCSHFADVVAVDKTQTVFQAVSAVLSSIFLRGRFGDKRFYPSSAELFALMALGRATLYRSRERALRANEDYRRSVMHIFNSGDFIVAPTAVYPAPRHGRANWNLRIKDCVIPGNLIDATALAIPFGSFADGLPRSLQILGPPATEEAVLRLGEQLAYPPRIAADASEVLKVDGGDIAGLLGRRRGATAESC
jgi:Asp-tRNA(Asn)/Glu-tRNA(Gln) amidotransferase A subunit family amidase